MKNILFYEPAGFAPKKKAGGSLISLMQILQRLDRNAFHPVVVLCHDYDCAGTIENYGCTLITLRQKSARHSGRSSDPSALLDLLKKSPFRLLLKNLRTLYRRRHLMLHLFRIIRDNEIDLVHCNSKYEWSVEGILPAWISGKPCICHTRSYLEKTSWVFGSIGKMVARHIAISSSIHQDLLDHGVSPVKVSLLPNWINISSSEAEELPDVGYSPDDTFKILSVGRIIPWKGIHILIEAIRILTGEGKRISTHIYGAQDPESEYVRRLHHQVERYGLESAVHFMGYAEKEEIYARPYHLSVHAATAPEPFGRVIIEAMYRQIPVIASRLGGVPDIIQDDGNGLLCEPGSPDELAGKIRKLMDDDPFRRRLAVMGRRSVIERFSEKGRLEHLALIYNEVMTSR